MNEIVSDGDIVYIVFVCVTLFMCFYFMVFFFRPP